MSDRININEIPDEMMRLIRNEFEKDPKVRHYMIKQGILQREGKFAEAMKIGKMLEENFTACCLQYIQQAEKQMKQSVDLDELDCQSKQELIEHFVAMHMMFDMFESCYMDLLSILKRSDDNNTMPYHEDINNLMKMIKQKMSVFSGTSDYLNDLSWGEKCDNLYEMTKSKARSILRKHKTKSWGKSYKELSEKYK